MLKLNAIGVAAGMEKKLKEFSIAPKKATKDTKNKYGKVILKISIARIFFCRIKIKPWSKNKNHYWSKNHEQNTEKQNE